MGGYSRIGDRLEQGGEVAEIQLDERAVGELAQLEAPPFSSMKTRCSSSALRRSRQARSASATPGESFHQRGVVGLVLVERDRLVDVARELGQVKDAVHQASLGARSK